MNRYAALRVNNCGHNTSQFSMMTLQREACSSREAVFYTLKNMLQKEELATPSLSRANPIFNYKS